MFTTYCSKKWLDDSLSPSVSFCLAVPSPSFFYSQQIQLSSVHKLDGSLYSKMTKVIIEAIAKNSNIFLSI